MNWAANIVVDDAIGKAQKMTEIFKITGSRLKGANMKKTSAGATISRSIVKKYNRGSPNRLRRETSAIIMPETAIPIGVATLAR